jgi:glutamate 5-kinase
MRVLLVSSGAVAEGLSRLGLKTRPEKIHELQAAAAVGQMGLVQAYERAFARHDRHAAVVLLTHDDMSNRQRYLNARATLTTLLDLGAVPVINENDSVATDEIRFGDNDTLAALATNLLQADLLIMLTDTDGLHDSDPRQNPDATLLSFAEAGDSRLDTMVAGSGTLGRGGMITKLKAARLAARSGAHTVIANGRTPSVLGRIIHGEGLGTLLAATVSPAASPGPGAARCRRGGCAIGPWREPAAGGCHSGGGGVLPGRAGSVRGWRWPDRRSGPDQLLQRRDSEDAGRRLQ